MTIDHLSLNPLRHFTFETFGFIGPAAGFIFISGFTAGMVFGRIQITQGSEAVRRKAWHRARDIYLAQTLILTIVVIAVLAAVTLTTVNQSLVDITQQPLRVWLLGLLLLYQPPYSDVLPMYCIFFIAVPYVLHWIHKGQERRVFLISLGSWFFGQWLLRAPWEHLGIFNLGYFNLLAWQLLFVIGVYLGYRLRRDGRSWVLNSFRLFVVCLSIVLLFLSAISTLWSDESFHSQGTGYLTDAANFSL